MRSFNEFLILDTFHLQVYIDREAFHFLRTSDMHRRVDLRVRRCLLFTRFSSYSLQSTEETRYRVIASLSIAEPFE